MKILDFFQGVFNFPISSDMVRSACYMRGWQAENPMDFTDIETQELIMADILVMPQKTKLNTQKNRILMYLQHFSRQKHFSKI